MATEKQLRLLKLIKSVLHKEYTGDINNNYKVSDFISIYFPIIKNKSQMFIKTNKRERYVLRKYKTWKL